MPEEKTERIERLRVMTRKSFRAQRVRAPIDGREAIDLARADIKSGEGAKDRLAAKDLAQLQDQVRFGRGVGKFRRPEWVGKLSKSDARANEIFDAVLSQVMADPTEETLRAAQLVLNDLGRTDLGPEYFRQIDQKLVDRLFKSRKER